MIRYLLVAAGLGILLVNALLGHELYETYGRDVSRYTAYVHLDGWGDRQNVIIEAFRVWDGAGPPGHAYNPNRLGSQGGLGYVELLHGHGGCSQAWRPEPYRIITDTLLAWGGLLSGGRLGADPYAVELPPAGPGSLGEGRHFAHFVPACLPGNGTLVGYSVSVSGAGHMGAYFVDSEARLAEYLGTGSVAHYPGCYSEGSAAHGGSCTAGEGSGLLVLVPADGGSPTARVHVSMFVIPSGQSSPAS
ncbi:MAG: hypothetical protein MPI95_02690 [Nitrosopumilus sp.]|nr:hypothetical protein [Nitrosopumilus sp.]CAI9830989.1 hypothetical protein IBTHAUMO2_1130067 [Nitrosopumilaceae archaeon]MDA7941720.1 hypothetical protein [Nitrosopumilus sp.]MDA7943836.1 hypothetical protein [Nitrosopumilus sp.]MDA7944986.1 hypothetical protein [Nitrosopumilus sp.]